MTRLLVSLKPFVNTYSNKKARYCITCNNLATQEACFDVGEGISVVEKYCKACSEKAIA